MTISEKYTLLTSYATTIDRSRALLKTSPHMPATVHPASGHATLLALWNAFAGALDVGERPQTAARMKLPHNHMLRVPLVGIPASIVGAAIALAPQASAQGQDDNFLTLLARAGIPAHDGIPSVINYGHKVCQALDGGESASAVADTLANFSYAQDPLMISASTAALWSDSSGCR